MADNSHAIGTIDSLFTTVEETLKQQYKAAGTSESVQAQIFEALQAVHKKATKNGRLTGEKDGG